MNVQSQPERDSLATLQSEHIGIVEPPVDPLVKRASKAPDAIAKDAVNDDVQKK